MPELMRETHMRHPFCLIAILGTVLYLADAAPALSQTSDADARMRGTNEIIDTFKPKTRGITRGPKKEDGAEAAAEAAVAPAPAPSPQCQEALGSSNAGFTPTTRALSKKEREEVASCTKLSTKLDFVIPFAFNSVEIDPSAIPQLESMGRAMESDDLKTMTFVIAGHTDRKGGPDYNAKLSQRRAEAVRAYLMEHFNIGGRRLRAVGFGFDQPKTPGDPFADANRRVELIRAN